ncbi:hypothetical protein JJL56_27945 [Azospirillum sp. YIM DDC1]|uniref:Uncharacterized protein n=1 Tax=Azospirillum aestuarii TaxID=2802052 RepID=A0ABS1I7N6_9PROT|nr:hypothetical protein [Azospirillum aestuarii]MBK4722693.1 hypothetical protein [Azospirillum aestuarii]
MGDLAPEHHRVVDQVCEGALESKRAATQRHVGRIVVGYRPPRVGQIFADGFQQRAKVQNLRLLATAVVAKEGQGCGHHRFHLIQLGKDPVASVLGKAVGTGSSWYGLSA